MTTSFPISVVVLLETLLMNLFRVYITFVFLTLLTCAIVVAKVMLFLFTKYNKYDNHRRIYNCSKSNNWTTDSISFVFYIFDFAIIQSLLLAEIFGTTNGSPVLAKEKSQNVENSWEKTQYLMNTLYKRIFLINN